MLLLSVTVIIVMSLLVLSALRVACIQESHKSISHLDALFTARPTLQVRRILNEMHGGK
jgi:hypothetical protein